MAVSYIFMRRCLKYGFWLLHFRVMPFFKMHFTIAILIATVFGVIFNFFTIGRIVFKNKSNSNFTFIKFVLLYTVLYFLNIFIIMLLNLINNNLYINGAIAVVLLAIISFVINKYCVFEE